MKFRYAHEKLSGAVRHLAVNPGRVQERLVGAWTYHLTRLTGPNLIPDVELAAKLDTMYRRVTINKDAVIGSFAASILPMSDDEAVEMAADICTLADDVQMLYDDDALSSRERAAATRTRRSA